MDLHKERRIIGECVQALPCIDGLTFTTNSQVGIIVDADISLCVLKDGQPLGMVGLSWGLNRYYDACDDDDFSTMHPATRQYLRRALKAPPAWTITQMQATPGTLVQRQTVNFRRQLLQTLESIADQTGVRPTRYLPAALNYYAIPSVQSRLLEQYRPTPTPNCLLMNYDYTARRHGFVFSQKIGLFERPARL